MTRFLDGPAAGATLTLKRSPKFLRAVIEEREFAEWDALDQLADTPKPTEAVVAYRLVPGSDGWVHIDYRDRAGRRRGETIRTAEYRMCPDQPSDEELRSTDGWRAWCLAQVTRENSQ